MIRPMVCIDQLTWHELNVNDELTLQCADTFLRTVEQNIRRLLFKWMCVRYIQKKSEGDYENQR